MAGAKIKELPTISNNAIFSVAQLAELCCVRRGTIYRWVERGELRPRFRKNNARTMWFLGIEVKRYLGITIKSS